jgi:hypothetical protein
MTISLFNASHIKVWTSNKFLDFSIFFLFQIEDAAMAQQVESYKYALREWDEQQQRHRAALQHAR